MKVKIQGKVVDKLIFMAIISPMYYFFLLQFYLKSIYKYSSAISCNMQQIEQ